MITSQVPSNSLRGDLIVSLILHAVLIGGLMVISLTATPTAFEKKLNVSAANANATPAQSPKVADQSDPESPNEAAALANGKIPDSAIAADPADAVSEKPGETTTEPVAPVRTAAETGEALLGLEAKESITAAVPLGIPESVKTDISAALDRATSEAMAKTKSDGKSPTRSELELASAESVIGQLRSQVSEEFGATALRFFSRKAYDATLKQLETAAIEKLGPKERELLENEGAALAGGDATQSPQRTAEIAIQSGEGFRKTLDQETRRVLAEVASAGIADTAEEIIRRKLEENGVPADLAAMAKMRETLIAEVAANAAKRPVNTNAVWKPSAELILPGTRKKKDDAALTEKVGEVAKKQDELIRSTLPELASEVGKSARWNEVFHVTKETRSKIDTLKRLETHVANLKAGRGGAAEASLASSLASLLGSGAGSAQGSAATDPALNFDVSGPWRLAPRIINEAEYQKLIARLEGRPANAGSEPDLQRVAGEPVNAGGAQTGILAPARIVTLVTPVAEPAQEETPSAIPPPPFPSIANGFAFYAKKRPTIDGDLSDWNLNAPPLKVRLLSTNTLLETGPDVYLQWRGEGLYFAYRLEDTGGIQVSRGAPYHGDIAEVFVDSTNSRAARTRDSNSTHHYCFMPFGYGDDPTRTFHRIGSGVSVPTGMDLATLDRDRTISFSAAKQVEGGYTVEGFLSIEALKRRLAPGIYLGFDISISPDFDFLRQMQWATSKFFGSWHRPNTWGDLLLVGTTARLLFLRTNGEVATAAAAGETLIVQVDDPDMNLDTGSRETVAVKVALADDSGAQVLLLKETGVDTGVFQGPCALIGPGMEVSAGAVAVRGGQAVQLTYIDAVTGAGQRNHTVVKPLNIGWPVLRLVVRTPR